MLYVNPLATRTDLSPTSAPDSPARRKEVLQEFERILLLQMLKSMRATVPENELFGRSSALEYYEEMQDDFLAGQMAKSGQFGMAKIFEAQLARAEHPARPQGPSPGYPLHPAPAAFSLQDLKNSAALPINKPATTGLPLRRVES